MPGFVRTTTTLDANKYSQSYTYVNGKGQTIRSAAETPDGWSIGTVEYDDLGRPRKTYNPFYGSTPVAAVPGGTAYSAVTDRDLIGRTTEVTLQDGTKVGTAYGYGSDFTYVTVTDQAGKQRRQVADALGRVVRVDEPNGSGALGTVTSPAQPTYYEYDGNDNLAKVTQSDGTTTQERKFLYDSLSRLVAERQKFLFLF